MHDDPNPTPENAFRDGSRDRLDGTVNGDSLPGVRVSDVVDANDQADERYGLAPQNLPELWQPKEDH